MSLRSVTKFQCSFTYSHFNSCCQKTYTIRLQGAVGNLLINLPNLAMAHPYTLNKSHRQVFMVLTPIVWQQQPQNHSESRTIFSYPYCLSVSSRKLEALKSENIN